jgi:AcrR family transcriptional regulator
MPTAASRPRPSARSRRWLTAAPLQRRSRETLERFATAAEALLHDRPFERITVQEIVSRARRPIGSFYARFPSKEALLPHLYERYDRTLETTTLARIGRITWDGLDLVATAQALIDALVGMYEDRRWLLRALALFARQHPEALSDELFVRRRRLYDELSGVLLHHRRRITHDDPEGACRFGIFFVSSIARDRLLFSEAPHARITDLPAARLRAELTRALLGYLTQRKGRR